MRHEGEGVGKVGLPTVGAGPVRIVPLDEYTPAPTLRPDLAPPVHTQPPPLAAKEPDMARRTCAHPGCSKLLPADADKRKRYCAGHATKQAEQWRHRQAKAGATSRSAPARGDGVRGERAPRPAVAAPSTPAALPSVNLPARSALTCHVERADGDDPELIIGRPDEEGVRLDLVEAGVVLAWLRDVLKAWPTLAAVLVLALVLPAVASAQANTWPAPWWQAVGYIQTFKALQLLPPWADLQDDWRFLDSADSRRKVVCVRDRATGAQWTATGDLARFIAGAQGDLGILMALAETNAGPRPRALQADVDLCWPPAPTAQRFPVTLGEPVYRAIVHVRADRSAPLDWPAMAKLTMGQAPVGAACSVQRIPEPTEHPDPVVGWHHAPGGGLTRCRP